MSEKAARIQVYSNDCRKDLFMNDEETRESTENGGAATAGAAGGTIGGISGGTVVV